MTASLTIRLTSLALAFVVTVAIGAGIDGLAQGQHLNSLQMSQAAAAGQRG